MFQKTLIALAAAVTLGGVPMATTAFAAHPGGHGVGHAAGGRGAGFARGGRVARYGRGYGYAPVYNGPVYDDCSGYGYGYGPGYGYGGCPGYAAPFVGGVINGVLGGYGPY